MVTPNCFGSLGCQIASILRFLTGASAKLKRGHVKRYAVVQSVLGASRSGLCPGPRVHSIRPWCRMISIMYFLGQLLPPPLVLLPLDKSRMSKWLLRHCLSLHCFTINWTFYPRKVNFTPVTWHVVHERKKTVLEHSVSEMCES